MDGKKHSAAPPPRWDSGHLFRSSILTKDFQAASGNRTQSPADHD
eukprot:CAMPEP_0113727520 /NCGR_PEP_ID=MMETSP0038_2-20120614/41210_1 /TAXON_ID=2898 /ORGANISM="Cryptomonas paramecium" /LENGTH=44 /DNA_ID=CAMNT_0000658601 /DNA_START=56 /DNA_END=187 /DNA_ORIENTATION=+ /assembly_acc=CAM_ASM_000170